MSSSDDIPVEYSDVSTSEFFYDNMAMLGFSSPAKALMMSVKELVDNSLDSCADIEVLPNIELSIRDADGDVLELRVRDNGSGIPDDHVEEVFTGLLYGSRFGVLRQTRGQQGMGVSAVVMWSQKHVAHPVEVVTSTEDESKARSYHISTEDKGGEPKTERKGNVDNFGTGTEIVVKMKANWRNRKKIEEYIRGTSLANPSLRMEYTREGCTSVEDATMVYERSSDKAPSKPEAIDPHPHSIDIGSLERMCKKTSSYKLRGFLSSDFCTVGPNKADDICAEACIDPEKRPDELTKDEIESIVNVIPEFDFYNPPTDSLDPLGEDLIRSALDEYCNPEYIGVSARNRISIMGHPTIVETGIAYGGDIDGSEIYRVGNRVPLVYDSSGCSVTKGVESVDWTLYELDNDDTGMPKGAVVIFVHVCSTQLHFKNKAKTHLSSKGSLDEEVKLSLQSSGREFSSYLKEKQRKQKQKEKVKELDRIYEDMSTKLSEIVGKDKPDHRPSVSNACSVPIHEGDSIFYNPTDEKMVIRLEDSTEVEIDPDTRVKIEGSPHPKENYVGK